MQSADWGRHWRRRFRFLTLDGWCVASFRQVDDDWVPYPLAGIVLCQACPQTAGFGSYDRVQLRIKIRLPAEHLHTNDGFLQLTIFPIELVFDHKAQEFGHPLVPDESRTGQDFLQFLAHLVGVHLDQCHIETASTVHAENPIHVIRESVQPRPWLSPASECA